MKTIIVDNEQEAISSLSIILKRYCSNIQIVGSANSVKKAVDLINSEMPDLIFLDVEMNNETGFDLLKHFPYPTFDVVFTTAYEKYAIQAIKASCFDFLLKPINFEELIDTVDRMRSKIKFKQSDQINNLLYNVHHDNVTQKKLAVPNNEKLEFINVNDIICLKADTKYTHIYVVGKIQLLSSKNIGEYEDILDAPCFQRIHRSWIINVNYLESFDRSTLEVFMTDGIICEVSTRKKEEFFKTFLK